MALPHTKTTFSHCLRSTFPPNYDLSGGYDTHPPIPPTPRVIKELQKKLPFLPGHQFDIEKSERPNERKSHAFDYCNGVAVFKEEAPGIAGKPLTNQEKSKVHTSVEIYPHNADGGKSVPAWVAFDRKVLRFYAYFQEAVHERREEQYRVRRVNIYFYLEDDSVHVSEPKTPNSGIPQGTLIRRHRIPKPESEHGQHYTVRDFNVGKEVTFYGRTFKIIGCDGFTRVCVTSSEIKVMLCYLQDCVTDIRPQDFLSALNIQAPPNTLPPPDPYTLNRLEILSRMKPTRPRTPQTTLKKFLENDRRVLRFYCVWDDTTSVFGDLRHMVIHYFLSDDTIEIRESIPANSGRESNTLFLRRCRLPKRPRLFLYGHDSSKEGSGGAAPPSGDKKGATETEYFTDRDFTIGTVLHLYGRPFVICDCDEFTREYYRDKYGVEEFNPVNIEDYAEDSVTPSKERLPYSPIPPDLLPFPPTSLSSLAHPPAGVVPNSIESAVKALSQPLIPGTTKHNKKLSMYDGVVLRYSAKLKSTRQVDQDRRFVISLSVSDDGVSVFEPRTRNSGVLGGKFLERGRILKPGGEGRYYGCADFAIGAELTFFHHPFIITNADEYAIKFMDKHPEMFPLHHQQKIEFAQAQQQQQAFSSAEPVITSPGATYDPAPTANYATTAANYSTGQNFITAAPNCTTTAPNFSTGQNYTSQTQHVPVNFPYNTEGLKEFRGMPDGVYASRVGAGGAGGEERVPTPAPELRTEMKARLGVPV
ncbi:EF-hand domain-containing member C2 [Rhizophlyctis rosea]|uniref:EF-hand domain-containing member C2 n=1 Tax=Rhizophlyctis rosea TaxID=64517 RepID=A0AAD5X5L5_9FUNG|nr:EF-hand domain-containing member C2 [Rhizophlyctis rosea]